MSKGRADMRSETGGQMIIESIDSKCQVGHIRGINQLLRSYFVGKKIDLLHLSAKKLLIIDNLRAFSMLVQSTKMSINIILPCNEDLHVHR